MKLLKTWLILSGLLLAGCMKNDMGDCPYNVMLSFRYNGDGPIDRFAEVVDAVTLYVFDSDSKFVCAKTLTESELRAYQGINLKLDPGKYRFVCWGNTFSNTAFVGEEQLQSARLYHPNLFAGREVQTNDPLYFGSEELVLPKDDIIAGEVLFASAHINMEIYTKGVEGMPAKLPPVEVQNLLAQYDFTMTTCGSPMTYYPSVAFDAEKNASVSKLQVMRFADDNPITIDIKDPLDKDNSIARLDLKEFMADNNIHVDGIHEVTIQILVEFGPLDVHITIPDWESEDITPEAPGYN